MTRFYISAGHSIYDKGYSCGCGLASESEWTIKIRDELKKLVNAEFPPDTLSLRDTIDWINFSAKPDDFSLEIHLNAHQNKSIRGVETYYSDTPRYADIFARNISLTLGIPNRGPKHDSLSYVGSLGFLRQLKCPSVIIECLYMTNEQDKLVLLNGGPEKIARGIKRSLDTLFAAEQLNKMSVLLETLKKQLLKLLKL